MDVFSGFGSVVRTVQDFYPHVDVFASDIVKREGNNIEWDARHKDSLEILLRFALSCLRRNGRQIEVYAQLLSAPTSAWCTQFKLAKVTVLFHLSTPCETYSTAAGSHHRKDRKDGGRPEDTSDLARAHDAMNNAILAWTANTDCFGLR